MAAKEPENLRRIEKIALALPEAERVDVEAWDGEPTFRVRNKNFVFANADGRGMALKLPKEEAEAVVGSDPSVDPMGYGLGRHGWISIVLPARPSKAKWGEITEWIRTSYTLVAPKKLANQVLEQDGLR